MENSNESRASGKPNPIRFRGDGFGRITLPKDLCTQIGWLRGEEPIDAWLLLLSDGRFGLLSKEEAEADSALDRLRAIALSGEATEKAEPSSAVPPEEAALVAKLTPITLKPRGQVWRFSIPSIMEIFAPPNSNLLDLLAIWSNDGYWELWYVEAFKRAALGPLPQPLRRRDR
jgi:hypothetical protein